MAQVTRAYVALGSNLGDRLALLRHGRDMMAALAVERAVSDSTSPRRLRASGVYETSPVGGPRHQADYLNAVVEVRTELDADALLARLMLIERQSGRVRGVLDGPRSLDLDLLLFEEASIDTPSLQVPHPRLHERRFVLEPLAELAAELVHPRLNRTIADLRDAARRDHLDQRLRRLDEPL